MKRRATFAVLTAVLACAVATATGWRARPARAAGTLYSYGLNAEARGFQVFQDDPVANARNAEGEVPEARASLNTGPVGYALASVAWPGPLAANAGTLILVASAQAPPEVKTLDYPVRAEARTGQNPPTTTYNTVPGTSLTATAKSDLVSADASVANTLASTGTFGPARAFGKTALVGGTGTAEASNIVNDVVLAGGAVTIKSFASSASAKTDGAKGSGKTSAAVVGLSIGGQPVTIDEQGVHGANAASQQALSQAGIDIVLSAPTKEIKGSTATFTASSLVVAWKTDSSVFGAVLGGAMASAAGTPGLEDTLVGLTGEVATPGTGAGGNATTGSSGTSSGEAVGGAGSGAGTGAVGSSALPGVAGDAGAATPQPSAIPQVGLAAAPAAAHGTLIKMREVVVLLLLGLILGAALKAMSDHVLADKAAAIPCSLEEGT
jgi:hypothetical protein